MHKLLLVLMLAAGSCSAATKVDTSDAPIVSEWVSSELNEAYMRSISKNECEYKTIAFLKECDTDNCLKTMAGVTGDCISYAKGSQKEFCKSYESNFILPNCNNSTLSKKSCAFLEIGKSTFCK